MAVLIEKIINGLSKFFVVIFWFLYLTGCVYFVGQLKSDPLTLRYLNVEFLNYFVFAVQLIFGGYVFDILKTIFKSKLSWKEIALKLKDSIVWLLFSLITLVAGIAVKNIFILCLTLFVYALYNSQKALTKAAELTKIGIKEAK